MTSLSILSKLGISLAAMLAFLSISSTGHAQCYKQNLSVAQFSSKDHQGGDYNSIPNVLGFTCSYFCQDDPQCVAWTYVTSNSTCYLKNQIGTLVSAPGMTTGRKFEPDTNYAGGDEYDYRSIANSTTPGKCDVACMADSRCKAWTWVQSNSTCYLKNAILAKTAVPGMVSASYGIQCMY